MTGTEKLKNLTKLIAVLLFFGWAIGYFGEGASGVIRAIIIFGFFALILRNFQSNNR